MTNMYKKLVKLFILKYFFYNLVFRNDLLSFTSRYFLRLHEQLYTTLIY